MTSDRTNKYWTRLKIAIVTPVIGFILFVSVWGILVPAGVEGSGVNFNTYPIAVTFGWIWLLTLLFAPWLLWHSLYRDKQELSKDFPDVNERHWITIGALSFFSVGLYPLWYLYARYKRTTDNGADESSVSDEKRSAPAENSSRSAVSEDATDTSLRSVVNETLERGDSLREKAKEAHDTNDYDSALEKYVKAHQLYEDALETVKESEHRTVDDIDDIEQKLAAIESAQREVQRQQLQERIESFHSDLDHVDRLADRSDLEEAQERLEDLESDLASVKETVAQYDFDDLYDKITTLEQRRKERLTEITEQLEAYPIPDRILRAPDQSVEYNELTNKEPIGGGGNADVTKATLPTPDGDIILAIKEPRLSGTLHTDQVKRMLREAETWDKLDDHDHIVGVVDYGSEPIPWIAMEYMDGGHLGTRSGAMEMPETLWTAIAVTKGVRHAHTRGVAHLDLKPENILLRTVDDAWDVPKVADWGLSKHLLKHSKSVEGMSPHYAAPEQFEKEFGPTDNVTDIYQLGAVFYELFTGQPPFEGRPTQVMRAVINKQPAPPSEIADIPETLDDILLTALAKEKSDRYDDIIYLRDDLRELFEAY